MKKNMTKKFQYILYFGIAAILFALSLTFFSKLCEPKYVTLSREGNLIGEYYKEADAGNRHDVIFIGDCEAYSSFIPPVMYEKYGIRSFVRGSPSQSIAQSYHLIRETLEYETPSAVVFSVYAMCREGSASEAYNRMTLDSMRLSSLKLDAVRESVLEDESIMSYYLPILRFHTRIYELEDEDIKYLFRRPSVSHNGYFMQKGEVAAENVDFPEGAAEPLPDVNFEYLDRMRTLCRDSGVELILVKTPLCSWRYPWYEEWDSEIEDYAARHGLSYYNLIDSADEIGIDMKSDSFDGGLHLNVYGAEKVSLFFGEILKEGHNILGEKNNIWDEKVKRYYEERN